MASLLDEDMIRSLVARLARPHPSGGKVIERAAILASGTDSGAVLAWIEAHGAVPETVAPAPAGRGLHSARLSAPRDAEPPRRYVLPPEAFA
jgi:hypothetical protein